MTIEDAARLIAGNGGVIVLLLLALVGLWRKWWVPGWLYDDERETRRFYEQLAWSGTNLAEKAVDVAEKKAARR